MRGDPLDNSVNIRSVAPGAALPTGRPDRQANGKALPASGQKLPPEPAREPTPAQLDQAVQQLQSYLNDSQRQLQFQVDAGSGRTIVRVVNPDTGELIRQIPSDEMLTLARAIGASGGRILSDLV